jgi:hypothetical protein
MLVYPHGIIWIESSRGWCLAFDVSDGLGLMSAQRLAKWVIVP